MKKIALVLSSCLLFAACASDSEETSTIGDENAVVTDDSGTTEVTEAASTSIPESNEDGPILQGMEFDEFSEAIESGLGCSFESSDSDDPLLVASSTEDIVSGEAVVKLNDILVVMAQTGKGYEDLQKGDEFTTEALTITVERDPGDGELVGVETTTWPATMTVTQDEGGTTTYEGDYLCGA